MGVDWQLAGRAQARSASDARNAFIEFSARKLIDRADARVKHYMTRIAAGTESRPAQWHIGREMAFGEMVPYLYNKRHPLVFQEFECILIRIWITYLAIDVQLVEKNPILVEFVVI